MSNLNNVRFRQEQVSVFNGNNCPLSAGFSVRNRRNTHDIPNNTESLKILNSLIIVGLDNTKMQFSNKPGIYKFGTFTSHSSFHLLIIDEETSNIVNMKESLDVIMSAIIDYYDKHQSKYTICDLSLSMKNAILLHRANMDAIPWKIEKNNDANLLTTVPNTDGKFHRLVTVFANRFQPSRQHRQCRDW